ncbi:MAG: hypothetical protein M1821_005812 [Bathelium mastoideum]|nr:MAG: hypothetical protein M1821_005812 [Bathelium mastoideum]
MSKLAPNLTLLPVSPEDAPELVAVYFAAFQNAHSLVGWPRTPTVRKWWEDMLAQECQDAHSHMLKIVDSAPAQSNTNNDAISRVSTNNLSPKIVAFGKWNRPRPEVELDKTLPEWPDGSAKELNQTKFGQLVDKRVEIMGPMEDYWYLELIATHPSYQGRGLGSILLDWGTSRADTEDRNCYVEASPSGLPLYRKFGFSPRNPATDYVEVDIKGHGLERDVCLVRPAHSSRAAQ